MNRIVLCASISVLFTAACPYRVDTGASTPDPFAPKAGVQAGAWTATDEDGNYRAIMMMCEAPAESGVLTVPSSMLREILDYESSPEISLQVALVGREILDVGGYQTVAQAMIFLDAVRVVP